MRLKSNEKAAFRAKLLKKQGGICPLCENEIRSGQDTLDHCHTHGNVRMVLCRQCNSVEGRVLHWAKRVKTDPCKWLTNLMDYWGRDFTHNPEYPTYKNETEKEIQKLRKKMKRVKKQKTKAKYHGQIDRLTRGLRR